ncbi:hypothetical protein GCM10010912_42750 [Paenibacillus albidus]|uniref:AEC family transporter n=1 Tax=Paenibacillus albidus TaxID=2041023 RepID=A0A917CMF2_9BACL|nr:hypothetical protein GCM10010912_42750 [Paenibacillus albidus]
MIQSVLSTLYEVIVPLSIPVIAGALLGRFKNLDTKPLLVLYLYFLSPAIILDTLASADISFDDVYKTLAFSLINLLFLWALANGLGRILKLAPPEAAGLTLVSTFTNSVNYGLPLVLLAFGQLGLDKASVYVIGQMVIVNTIGVYFAARSQFSGRCGNQVRVLAAGHLRSYSGAAPAGFWAAFAYGSSLGCVDGGRGLFSGGAGHPGRTDGQSRSGGDRAQGGNGLLDWN